MAPPIPYLTPLGGCPIGPCDWIPASPALSVRHGLASDQPFEPAMHALALKSARELVAHLESDHEQPELQFMMTVEGLVPMPPNAPNPGARATPLSELAGATGDDNPAPRARRRGVMPIWNITEWRIVDLPNQFGSKLTGISGDGGAIEIGGITTTEALAFIKCMQGATIWDAPLADDLADQIREGVADTEAGRTVSRGSFAQYLDEEGPKPVGTHEAAPDAVATNSAGLTHDEMFRRVHKAIYDFREAGSWWPEGKMTDDLAQRIVNAMTGAWRGVVYAACSTVYEGCDHEMFTLSEDAAKAWCVQQFKDDAGASYWDKASRAWTDDGKLQARALGSNTMEPTGHYVQEIKLGTAP